MSAIQSVTVDETVKEATARIKARLSRTAEDIIEIGRDLIAVKKALGHGRFLDWIDDEFGMSDQTARRFMHVAEAFGDKINTVLNLPQAVLYELAAPSMPPAIRAEAIERAVQGELPTAETVREFAQAAKVGIPTVMLVREDPPCEQVEGYSGADLRAAHERGLKDRERGLNTDLERLHILLEATVPRILADYPHRAPEVRATLMDYAQRLLTVSTNGKTKRLTLIHSDE